MGWKLFERSENKQKTNAAGFNFLDQRVFRK
jgi:hypothetical protein